VFKGGKCYRLVVVGGGSFALEEGRLVFFTLVAHLGPSNSIELFVPGLGLFDSFSFGIVEDDDDKEGSKGVATAAEEGGGGGGAAGVVAVLGIGRGEGCGPD
jgi:hypothetical protein